MRGVEIAVEVLLAPAGEFEDIVMNRGEETGEREHEAPLIDTTLARSHGRTGGQDGRGGPALPGDILEDAVVKLLLPCGCFSRGHGDSVIGEGVG